MFEKFDVILKFAKMNDFSYYLGIFFWDTDPFQSSNF